MPCDAGDAVRQPAVGQYAGSATSSARRLSGGSGAPGAKPSSTGSSTVRARSPASLRRATSATAWAPAPSSATASSTGRARASSVRPR